MIMKKNNNYATKTDLNLVHKDLLKGFESVFTIMSDAFERIDKQGKRIDEQNERLIEQGKKQDAILEELKYNRIIMGNHEQRIQKIEGKSYSPTQL